MKNTKVLYLFLFILLESLPAQTLNLQTIPSDKMQFGVSFEKPFYPNNYNYTTLSGVYNFSFNIPISTKYNLIGNIPYVNTSYDIHFGVAPIGFQPPIYKYDIKGVGNIFIGLQTNRGIIDNKRSIYTFGLFLPTDEKEAALNGLFTNYYDLQKFIANTLGIYFNYAYHRISEKGFTYGFEVGPNMIIPVGENRSESEMFLHYGVNVGYQINRLSLNMEYLGITLLTSSTNNFSDKLIHILNFGTQWKGSTITPKIFYKFYLKENMRNIIDGVLGLGITVSINK